MTKIIKIHFDGSCAPKNPHGFMGWGSTIEIENELFKELYGFESSNYGNTNNVAEYLGLKQAIEFVIDYICENKIEDYKIEVFGDSKLVINQCIGYWKIKDGFYKKEALLTNMLINENLDKSKMYYKWIPRSDNYHADELSNRGYAENGIIFFQDELNY